MLISLLLLMSYISAFPTASTTLGATSDTVSWLNETDALTDNGTPAFVTWEATSTDTQSDYLRTRFALGVPSGSTIQGFEIDIERCRLDNTHTAEDHTVSLVRGSSRVGTNFATSGIWPDSTYIVKTYGGPENLAGETWATSDLNSTNFGVDLKIALQTTGVGISAVDYIAMRAHWVTSGVAGITFSGSGTLNGLGSLSGQSAITFTPAATINGVGALSGNTAITFTPSASISAIGALSGSASIAFTPSGMLTGNGALSGAATMTFTPSATIQGIGELAGTATITFTVSGRLDAIPEKPLRYTSRPHVTFPGSQQPIVR